jgi:hypothetical protein
LVVWNPGGQIIADSENLPMDYSGFAELPHGKPALAYNYHGTGGAVYLLNEDGSAFKTAPKLGGKQIHTFAGDGTAMTTDGKMWINGELIPLRNLCPAYGDLIDDGWDFHIHGANRHGVYLIQAHNADQTIVTPLLLLPVEVIIPKIDSNGNQIDCEFVSGNKLKVAKWEDAFEGTFNNGSVKDDFIGWDKDRFYIRIPGGNSLGVEAFKIATEDCPDSSYNDDPTTVPLMADGDDTISDSMILVSDNDDDNYAGSGVGVDDQEGDRTHKVQLGGKLVIKSITINGEDHDLNMKIPVAVRKVLPVDFIRMNVPGVRPLAEIEQLVKIVNERYAQVGLRVNATIKEIPWPNIPDRQPGYLDLFDTPPGGILGPLSNEYKSFIDQTDSSAVNIFYLIAAYSSNGIAITPSQLLYESGEIDGKYLALRRQRMTVFGPIAGRKSSSPFETRNSCPYLTEAHGIEPLLRIKALAHEREAIANQCVPMEPIRN